MLRVVKLTCAENKYEATWCMWWIAYSSCPLTAAWLVLRAQVRKAATA